MVITPFHKVSSPHIRHMEQNRQRILLISGIQSPVAASERIIECSHVPADSCGFLVRQLDKLACKVQRFFAVTERKLIVENIDLLLDPRAVLLDVPLFRSVAVRLQMSCSSATMMIVSDG